MTHAGKVNYTRTLSNVQILRIKLNLSCKSLYCGLNSTVRSHEMSADNQRNSERSERLISPLVLAENKAHSMIQTLQREWYSLLRLKDVEHYSI